MSNFVVFQVDDETTQPMEFPSLFSSTDVRAMGSAERMVALQHKLAAMSDRTGGYWTAKRDSTIRAIELLSRKSE